MAHVSHEQSESVRLQEAEARWLWGLLQAVPRCSAHSELTLLQACLHLLHGELDNHIYLGIIVLRCKQIRRIKVQDKQRGRHLGCILI